MLFTALIAPFLIDWTSYRQTFEDRASAYLGRPVEVAGRADLRLLPAPVISFTDIRVGDREHPDAEIERFRAELELAPLLKGEVRIVDMAVERPRFSIDLADFADPARMNGTSGGEIDPERISLAGVSISNGSAEIVDSRSLRQWEVEDINASVSAGSLLGPARMEGGMVVAGERLSFDLGLGRAGPDGTLPLKLSATPVALPLTFNLDGMLGHVARIGPKFTGRVTVSGLAPQEEDAAPDVLAQTRGSGAIEIDPQAIAVEGFQLSLGPAEMPLLVDVAGRLDVGAEPRFSIDANARQIDADRALSGQTGVAASPREAGRRLLDMIAALPQPSIPGEIDFEAEGIVTGGSIIQSVAAELTPEEGGWRLVSFSAVMPGETRVEADGLIGTEGAATFDGHVAIGSQRPVFLASWLSESGDTAPRMGPLAAEADLALRPGEHAATNLRALVGEGTVTGALTRRRFQESDQSFVTVDLAADRFAWEDGRALVDLFGRLIVDPEAIEQMSLDLHADVLSAGTVEAHDVLLDATYQGETLRLARLSVGDLAGASIEAQGNIDDPTGDQEGRLTADIRADDLDGAVRFARMVLPDTALVRRFETIAPTLTPLSADLSMENGAEHLAIDIRGDFAGTDLVLIGEGRGSLGEPDTLEGEADVILTSDDSADFLMQFGLSPLPIDGAGPARLSARFEGALADGSLMAEGTLAGVALTFDGRTGFAGMTPRIDGGYTLASEDIDPLLIMSGFGLPGIGEGHSIQLDGTLGLTPERLALGIGDGDFDGSPVTGALDIGLGDGIEIGGSLSLETSSLPALASFAIGAEPQSADGGWQDRPIATAIPEAVTTDLRISARALDLGYGPAARNAVLDLRLGGGRFEVDLASADLAGGTLAGAVTATIADGSAQMSLDASLTEAALGELVWERQGRPVATGTLDASMNVTGSGRSVSGIVASLTGSGSFLVEDGLFRTLNPGAFDNVIRAADADLEIDEEHVAEVYAGHLDSDAFRFERLTGSFSVGSGVIRVPTVSVKHRQTTALAEATIDLNTGTLDSDWSLRAEDVGGPATGSAPQAGLSFSGPIDDPSRQIDVTPLVGYLTVRRFEQEVERVEKLQTEIMERDRLMRLMRLSREQAERREREAAAARAEAERRAEQERRAEEQRRAEEERRAAEEDVESSSAEPIQLVPQTGDIPLPPRPQAPLDLLGGEPRAPQANPSGDAIGRAIQQSLDLESGGILQEPPS